VRDHDGDAAPAASLAGPYATRSGDMYRVADGVFRMGSMSPSPPARLLWFPCLGASRVIERSLFNQCARAIANWGG
jgi:hypothetical protein